MSRKKRFKHAVKKEAKLEKLALAGIATVTVGMVGTTLVHADDAVPAPSSGLVDGPKADAAELPAENPASPVSADSERPASEPADAASPATPSSETNQPMEPVSEPSQPAAPEKSGEQTPINEKEDKVSTKNENDYFTISVKHVEILADGQKKEIAPATSASVPTSSEDNLVTIRAVYVSGYLPKETYRIFKYRELKTFGSTYYVEYEKDPDYNKPITVKEINRIELDDGTYKIIDEHVVTVNPGGFGLFNIPDLTAQKLIIPADGVFEYGPHFVSYETLKFYRIQESVNTYVYRDSVTALPTKTLHDSSGLVTAEVYAPSAIAVKTISVSKLVEPKDVDKVFVASATQKAEVYQVEMLKPDGTLYNFHGVKSDGTPYAYSGWKIFTIKTDKNRQIDEVLYFPFQSDKAERLSFKVDDMGNLTFTVPGGVRSVSPENYVVVYRLNTPSEPSKPVNPETPAQSTETLTNSDKNVSVTLTGADVAAVDKIVADKVSDKDVLAKLPAEMPAKDVELYDVKTQKADGSFVQITGEATVTLPVDASRKVVKVIYFLPETGAIEELPFELSADGKSVRFKVTHFSNYGVVYQAKSSEHPVTPANPEQPVIPPKPTDSTQPTKPSDKPITTIDNKLTTSPIETADNKATIKPVVNSVRAHRNAPVSPAKILPETGEKNVAVLTLAGVAAAISGFVGLLKKRKN